LFCCRGELLPPPPSSDGHSFIYHTKRKTPRQKGGGDSFSRRTVKSHRIISYGKWIHVAGLGFPTEFCSERVLWNRDETNFVISRKKVVISRNSMFCGMAYFALPNGRERNEITRKSWALGKRRTILKFFSKASLIFKKYSTYPNENFRKSSMVSNLHLPKKFVSIAMMLILLKRFVCFAKISDFFGQKSRIW